MRTLWMRLFVFANAAELAVFVYFLFTFVLPNLSNPQAAAFVGAFVAFIALFASIVAAATLWSGVLNRPWFWLVGALPSLAVVVLFAPQISYDIVRPSSVLPFISTLVVAAASITSVGAGVVAFRQVGQAKRGEPPRTPVRTRLGIAVFMGAIAGAALTAIVAGAAASGGGGSVAEAPTTTATIEARDTKYVQTSLQIRQGDVLGIFVINRDSVAHSFDIDSLNIHVQLAANSTTAVAVKPTAAGPLEFYCAVPGHKAAGMVGMINVQ